MKRLLLVLIALFAICTLTSCGNDVTFDESKGILVVGLECNYPPFNWLETKKLIQIILLKMYLDHMQKDMMYKWQN